jgi:uncharacterized membrane protein YeaQ/YmgE (transglycosylase-associated protein family)
MNILVWLVLGLVAGWIASRLMGTGGYGLIGDIVVGIIGAVVGGWLGSTFLNLDVTGFNVTSVVLAVIGAAIVLAIFRALSPGGRRA